MYQLSKFLSRDKTKWVGHIQFYQVPKFCSIVMKGKSAHEIIEGFAYATDGTNIIRKRCNYNDMLVPKIECDNEKLELLNNLFNVKSNENININVSILEKYINKSKPYYLRISVSFVIVTNTAFKNMIRLSIENEIKELTFKITSFQLAKLSIKEYDFIVTSATINKNTKIKKI